MVTRGFTRWRHTPIKIIKVTESQPFGFVGCEKSYCFNVWIHLICIHPCSGRCTQGAFGLAFRAECWGRARWGAGRGARGTDGGAARRQGVAQSAFHVAEIMVSVRACNLEVVFCGKLLELDLSIIVFAQCCTIHAVVLVMLI